METEASFCVFIDDGLGYVPVPDFFQFLRVRQGPEGPFADEVAVTEIGDASVGPVHRDEGLVVADEIFCSFRYFGSRYEQKCPEARF